jgi:hypothetical protein
MRMGGSIVCSATHIRHVHVRIAKDKSASWLLHAPIAGDHFVVKLLTWIQALTGSRKSGNLIVRQTTISAASGNQELSLEKERFFPFQ